MERESRRRLEEFIRDYGERAFQFAYRLSGNVEEAKDLVQEAFYRLVRRWESYDPSQALDAWFFTILRHVFLDGLRRYERRNAISLDAAVAEEGGSYADLLPGEDEEMLKRLERQEAAAEVRRALDALSYEHRAVLTLCDMQGLSYDEISQVLQIPVGTVRSRVSRARSAMRLVLGRTMEVT